MIEQDRIDLLALIARFFEGHTLITDANEIEGLVLQSFPDEAWADELVYALSMYRPSEGHPYLNEAQLAAELRPVAILLGNEPQPTNDDPAPE